MSRRSIKLPITLAVIMFVLLVALTTGWILITAQQAIWTLLTVGAVFFVLVGIGVAVYLTLSIKAINITKRQSNFIDSVTHELKSPIASLKLYLQTLTRRNVPEKERQEFYRFMLEDVDRLDTLINHVLEAARLERGESRRAQDEIRLDKILEDCAESVCTNHRVPRSSIRLELNPSVVHGTQVDLELIFRNLIDNGLKYGGDPPEVIVQLVELYNGRVCVRIVDNGGGIPMRYRNKIFRRFVRLGTELERKTPGTGLGLYIVRTLVKKLDGKIRLRSRDKKPGTIFEVTLPGYSLNEGQAPVDSTRETVQSAQP